MSSHSFTAMEENGASEEVEALKSIYIRELEVTNSEGSTAPSCISINLHPATADNTNEQYVCLTLVINLSPNYPHDLPEIVIRNPRGLSDEDLERIKSDLHSKASESKGNAMLFELIELVKEHLTVGNTPRCACAICLYNFTEQDAFTKTDCYHYFHSHCLSRYVEFMKAEEVVSHPLAEDVTHEVKILCPVCREPIAYEDSEKLDAPPPVLSESALDFKPDSELIEVQQRMATLFMKQKSQGGIIDVEAEKNKYLLEISMVPSEVTNITVTRNSRQHSQGGRKKRITRNVNSAPESERRDNGQSFNKQSRTPTYRQEGRDNRKGYLNYKTEHCALPEKGNGGVRRERGGFHSSGGFADQRQHNHAGHDSSNSKANRKEDQIPCLPRESSTEFDAAQAAVLHDCDQICNQNDGTKALKAQHRDTQNESPFKNHSASRQNVRRSSSRGASVAARSTGGFRGGQNNQRYGQSRSFGVEKDGDFADGSNRPSITSGSEQAVEEEKPRQGIGQGRRPYARRFNRWHGDSGDFNPRTGQDSYRQRTNRCGDGGENSGTGHRHDDRRRASGRSEVHNGEDDAHLDEERSCPNAEDLPVSHPIVLTGPPTKAFCNSLNSAGSGSELNRPVNKQVPEIPSLDAVQSVGPRDCVQLCASLPPGFKPKSQHFVPPPPGFETIA